MCRETPQRIDIKEEIIAKTTTLLLSNKLKKTMATTEETARIIAALQQPEAYPHDTESVKTIITAVSVVFLTGKHAYKINKPMNLGFLDFSTLEKRREQCEKEIRYNSLISPHLYEGLVTINQEENGKIAVNGPGKVIEYGIKMKQMNPDATMNSLLQQQRVKVQDIQQLAKTIHAFHQKAPADKEIAEFGKYAAVKFNWDENFQQTEKYQDTLIPTKKILAIQEKINSFLKNNQPIFAERVQKNKIKHCHGDFHSGNVFLQNGEISIFDGIVFNQRFPCSDIIAEIAFMAMDLEYHQQPELARSFIEEYQRLSNDEDIPLLLDFYQCYRAYIRGKIACFTYDDPHLTPEEKENTKRNAQQYFQLAERYAGRL